MVAGAREWVRAWRPTVPGISEVFHARFVSHAYPRHCHDTWTVLVVDRGAIRYDLEHHQRGVDANTVSVLPPGVMHDGRPASAAGFTKRVLYLDTSVIPVELVGRSVDRSDIADPSLRHEIMRLHRILAAGEDALAGEEQTSFVAGHLRQHLGAAPTSARPPDSNDADRLRDYLTAHALDGVTLAEAATALGRSVAHLSRSFRARHAIAPHAFVVGLRIDRARRLLLDGQPPSLVAAETGFCDQAHLHRHFRRHLGTTPGRYQSG